MREKINLVWPDMYTESTLQKNCTFWFRRQYPEYSWLLFSVPNGGKRLAKEASRLRSEGVVAGVADMLLLVPTQEYNILAIEFKSGKNKQTPLQEQWQLEFERFTRHKYAIVRSFDEFFNLINEYLK